MASLIGARSDKGRLTGSCWTNLVLTVFLLSIAADKLGGPEK